MNRTAVALGAVLSGAALYAQGGVGNLMGLQGKVDSNNALVVTLAASGTIGAGGVNPLSALRGKVDSSNALVVTLAGDANIGEDDVIVFEGATADAFETTLTVVDPTTPDKTITLPNETGTVALRGANTFTGIQTFAADGIAVTGNALALRNSTNAQAFHVYNTYTDASNYERAMVGWESSRMILGTDKAGTGLGRAIRIRVGGTEIWQVDGSGLIALTDNTYDIGSSGANRPRNFYGAGFVDGAGGFKVNGTAGVSGTVVAKGSDGNNCDLVFTGGILTSETCP